jgi:hypothetical protein
MKRDAGRRFAVVLNIWRFMPMMRKGGSECRVFGMWLGIVPADFLVTAIEAIAVVENLAVGQVEVFKETQLKTIWK